MSDDLNRVTAFCEAPKQTWPYSKVENPPILVATQFDSAVFEPEDFDRLKIHQDDRVLKAINKRKAEFLAGRVCARQALDILGQASHQPVLSNPDRSPAWPEGIVGSITHTDHTAAAIVANANDYRGVGIDFQLMVQNPKISRSILTSEEQQEFAQMDAEAGLLYLTRVFSIKESLYKALYPMVQQFFGFHDANVTSITEHSAKIHLRKNLNAEWQAGNTFNALHQHEKDLVKSAILIPA